MRSTADDDVHKTQNAEASDLKLCEVYEFV